MDFVKTIMKSSGGIYKEPKGEKSMDETVRNGDGVELTINNSTLYENLEDCKTALDDLISRYGSNGRKAETFVKTYLPFTSDEFYSLWVELVAPNGFREKVFVGDFDDSEAHWDYRDFTPEEKILRRRTLSFTDKIKNPTVDEAMDTFCNALKHPLYTLEDMEDASESEIGPVFEDLKWFYDLSEGNASYHVD